MTDERLHVGPVQERAVADQPAQTARQRSAQLRPRAGVDADHPPPSLDAGQLDLVRGHQARRVGLDVDELAGQHVLAEQHLPRAPLECAKAQLLAREAHRAGLKLGDPVHRHEQLAPADPRLESRHGRVAAVGQPHDQILDATEPLARTIEQRAAQKVRQVLNRLGQDAKGS